MSDKITYSHDAQVETVIDYLAKIDYHKSTLKIDIDGELKPIFDSDRENFNLIVRKALYTLLYEQLHNENIQSDIADSEIKSQAWQIADSYHIILDTKNIKKIQNLTLDPTPQTCDVIILGKGPREGYVRKAMFLCSRGCAELITVNNDKAIPIIHDKCVPHQEEFYYSEIKSQNDFIQRIVIQEQLTDAKNASPIDYDARIVGDMLNDTFVGQKKRVMLVPRFSSKNQKIKATELKLLFDVISIADLEEEKKLLPTNKEIEEYRKSSEDEGFFDKIIESFAPNVIGDETKWVKKALLLSLIGGNGGIEDGRADINVLLLGDPSVAKSSLLKYCQSVVQKGIYTSGKGASAAGLTIGMVKRSDGTMMAQPGILPLCNNGVALIDEFDKMDERDRSGMHEAMEQQSVSIAKAGTSLTLPAQTTVIAAANPKFGKWDKYMSILENANLPPALMSRFDLKFRILDIPDELTDQRKAAHILAKHREEKVTMFSRLHILALINYAKTLRPRISDEASLEIQKIWVRLRIRNKSEISIDTRQLESLTRMAVAHAKLHFKDFVDVTDVRVIYDLYKASLKSFDIDLESEGEQTYFIADRREHNKHETFWECFNKCLNDEGTVSKVDVLELMNDTKFFTQESAKVFFDSMAKGINQQMIEGADGRFRRIN